jgi:hypothetical protein
MKLTHDLFLRDEMPDHVIQANSDAIKLIATALVPTLDKIPQNVLISSLTSVLVCVIGDLVVAREANLKNTGLVLCKQIIDDIERLIELYRKEGKLIEQ